MKLKTKYIILTSIAIISCSLFVQIFRCIKYKCIKIISFINSKAVLINFCEAAFSNKEWYLESLIKTAVGIWLPMLIVALCYAALFIRLRQQALFRSRSSSSTSSGTQTQMISRTFSVIVCAFFICMLPGTTIWIHYTYLKYTGSVSYLIKNWSIYNAAIDISWAVTNLNCCLNPFIYGKLHRKLWSFIEKRIIC